MLLLISPYMLMVFCAFLILILPKSLRLAAIIAAPLIALASLWITPALLPQGNLMNFEYIVQSFWFNYEVTWIRLDIIARFMASIFALTALAGGIFAFKLARKKEIFTAYIYAACAIATILAGDLVSLMITWELLAISAVVLLWFSRERGAKNAAMRYGLWHFLGGAMLLAGIAMQMAALQDIRFSSVSLNHISGWFILIGIWLNTGMFPFTSWAPDAYPKASPSAAVFLSSFTTKTAVIVMLRLFWGEEILMYPALITIIIAGIYSFIEDDMRRLLCWSILMQVSFMVVAIAAGNELAYLAVPAMAAVHILYKSTLFMASGLVLHYTGESQLSKISGLIDDMPFVFILSLIAAVTSMAMPITGGFLAKTWLFESIDKGGLYFGWSALTLMSGFAILPTGLWFIRWLFGSDETRQSQPVSPYVTPQIAMLIPALLCFILALPLLWELAFNAAAPIPYVYSFKEAIRAFELIFASLAIGFFAMRWIYPRSNYTIGLDWLWREANQIYLQKLNKIQPQRIWVHITHIYGKRLQALFFFLSSPRSPFLRAKAISKQSLEVSVFLAFFIVCWVLFA